MRERSQRASSVTASSAKNVSSSVLLRRECRQVRVMVEASGDESGEGERRDEQRGRERRGLRVRIPGAKSQPVVQPEAEVRPGDDEQQALAACRPGIGPQSGDDALVADGVAEQPPVKPGRDYVVDEQRRDREAEHELRRLPGRHAQRRAPVERDERESEMREQRAVEHHRADRAAPPRGQNAAQLVHGLDRDHAERMVQKMAGDEAGDHQPRHEAKKPHPFSCRDLYSRNSSRP
jgi:hypothetical protein